MSKSGQEILDKVLEGPPTPLAELEPDAPADLLTIVKQAMARDSAKRYSSAKQLAEDLRRFETGQLVSVHEYSTAALVKRWMRRHRAAVSVAVVMVVVLWNPPEAPATNPA